MGMKEAVLVILSLTLPAIAFASPAFPPGIDEALRVAKEIYIATQRANGEMSSLAPVWFMYDGGAIYFATDPKSYKARRIRRGSPVDVWVGSKTGPHIRARGELLKDEELAEKMNRHYRTKYWIAWLGFFRPSRARLTAGKIILVKLVVQTG